MTHDRFLGRQKYSMYQWEFKIFTNKAGEVREKDVPMKINAGLVG